jgi:L-amino acid N-acyltransferase YncA
VFVAHGQTGRGIGSALLAALLDGCARGGTRQLVAVIADTGEPGSLAPGSVALHEAFGFTTAGRLHAVGFKHDRWIDTLLLQRAV